MYFSRGHSRYEVRRWEEAPGVLRHPQMWVSPSVPAWRSGTGHMKAGW